MPVKRKLEMIPPDSPAIAGEKLREAIEERDKHAGSCLGTYIKDNIYCDGDGTEDSGCVLRFGNKGMIGCIEETAKKKLAKTPRKKKK